MSVTSFKTSMNVELKPVAHVDVVEVFGSLVKEYFVSAQDICPSRISTIPFLDKTRAILLCGGNKKYETEYAKHHVDRNNEPSLYVMLPLNLEKKLYQTNDIKNRSFDMYM